ncbi:Crp/Fnr family transcriptional regulator [Candidatus Cyanaurora vandensis]|uniref:Crp/Fnr family transcriptional regulator n=1 Tax=Candidatus Cyanaurora vandensis TaxID=2714958 RepID=UPI00257BA130|nr:Crp/Fnr family transcriptional regulator [Candidatus Cyanaurora vandensis]
MSLIEKRREWLEDLYRERTLVPYKAGEVIVLRPRELGVVYRGVIQLLTLHASGDEVLLGLLGPMMPLGLPLTILDTYQAVALTDGNLLRVSWEEAQHSPRFAHEINLQLTRRLHQTEALLALAGKRRVLERIQGFMLLLGHEFGQITPDGLRVEIRLTHQQIANAMGTTRVTVTRLLSTLRAQGFLTVGRDRHIYLTHTAPATLPWGNPGLLSDEG